MVVASGLTDTKLLDSQRVSQKLQTSAEIIVIRILDPDRKPIIPKFNVLVREKIIKISVIRILDQIRIIPKI